MKSDGRQSSNKARNGLVFCRCGAAFVSSLREGSAGSWLVSSIGQEKDKKQNKVNCDLWYKLLFLSQQSTTDNRQQHAINVFSYV